MHEPMSLEQAILAESSSSDLEAAVRDATQLFKDRMKELGFAYDVVTLSASVCRPEEHWQTIGMNTVDGGMNMGEAISHVKHTLELLADSLPGDPDDLPERYDIIGMLAHAHANHLRDASEESPE